MGEVEEKELNIIHVCLNALIVYINVLTTAKARRHKLKTNLDLLKRLT